MNGTLYCSECGTDLITPIQPLSSARVEPLTSPPTGTGHNIALTVPKLVRASTTNKPKSNSLAARVNKTSPTREPKAVTSANYSGGLTTALLHLLILNSGRLIAAPAQQATIIIGRSDAITGDQPDIDLTQDNAIELGVSRRHACITLKDGKPFLSDLGSTNKTFLNRQPLLRGTPYELFDGDEVRLGNVVIKIIYSPPESK